MRIFALEKLIEISSKKWVFITHKNFARWQPGNVRNDLPVDQAVDRPTVIFITVVPTVDRPVDRPPPESGALSVGRPCGRPAELAGHVHVLVHIG